MNETNILRPHVCPSGNGDTLPVALDQIGESVQKRKRITSFVTQNVGGAMRVSIRYNLLEVPLALQFL